MPFKIDSYTYNSGVLFIGYYEDNDTTAKTHMLPNSALVTALKETNLVFDGNPYSEMVKAGACYPWLTIDQYMSHNLGYGMAETLLSHYLDNRTVKESGNYKTLTI